MENTVKFSKRFTAYLLDVLLVYIVLGLVLNIRFINPYYDKYMETYETYTSSMEELGDLTNINEIINNLQGTFYKLNKYSITYNIATCVILVLYFGVFQKYNNGQTLGKKIMKIKVVDKDEKNPSLWKYLIRELPLQFVYIGCLIPIILNTILVFILNSKSYMMAYVIITYLMMLINIVNICFILFRKDHKGLHDLLVGTNVVSENRE